MLPPKKVTSDEWLVKTKLKVESLKLKVQLQCCSVNGWLSTFSFRLDPG